MTDPEVLLRVSSDPSSGAGHLARMRALRSSIRAPVKWFIDPGTYERVCNLVPVGDYIVEETSKATVTKLLSCQRLNAAKLVVCDSYHITCADLSKSGAKNILFFCDDDIQSSSENITIVNCQPGATNRTNYLAGPTYTPIDVGERQQKSLNFDNLVKPINCLVSFGATDTSNLTTLAIEALLSEENLRARIRPICLVGPYFQHIETVKKLLNSFPESKIITECNSVLDLPFDCPLAIGAPGLSHAERLFLGTATVLIAQNDAHHVLCDRWQAEGCAKTAATKTADIVLKLEQLMTEDFKQARFLSRRGQEVIDGKGATRITQKVLCEVHAKN